MVDPEFSTPDADNIKVDVVNIETDAGQRVDAGVTDAGADAGLADAGIDAGQDAGVDSAVDAGPCGFLDAACCDGHCNDALSCNFTLDLCEAS